MLGISRLRNSVRNYAWGSHSAIAELLGKAVPSTEPEAELWMGDHPGAPSELWVGGKWVPLPEVVDHRGEETLGSGRHRLPFLFKVLAAENPLSIQAHPDAEQAREGFDREEALGISRDAAERNYRDPSAKPEILCALTPFTMLRGFRSPAEILSHFDATGIRGEISHAEVLADSAKGEPERLRLFLGAQLSWPERAAALPRIQQILERRLREGIDDAGLAARALSLADEYPRDPGILAPFFLHLLTLAPGEAVFTGAGIPHAYLAGVGMELMANSDNVLRGGLTRKHIDVEELLRVLSFESEAPAPMVARREEVEQSWDSPGGDLHLSLLRLSASVSVRRGPARGAEILLCTAGSGRIREQGKESSSEPFLSFRRGEALFIPAVVKGFEIHGEVELYRARGMG